MTAASGGQGSMRCVGSAREGSAAREGRKTDIIAKLEAEIRRKERELEDQKREMGLTIEKKVQESLPDERNKAKLVAAFAALYVVWGSTYLAIRIGLEAQMPPALFAGLRLVPAGLLLLACISPALTHLKVEAYWEKAIQGAIILLAVVADGTGTAVDVAEKDDAYLVKAMIPGVRKEDIHVEIDGNQVASLGKISSSPTDVLASRMPEPSALSVAPLTMRSASG